MVLNFFKFLGCLRDSDFASSGYATLN
ncbi:hypothetical protein RDI58_000887 [Solanum bulbocastanum]|uniref:Uncharacterized protein n=1 Tax=Solanum bulbocastanum TaxID=147425 RepID=A0AAN8U8D4_SOLBU